MRFDERHPFERQNAPAWVCTNPACGYRTMVRKRDSLSAAPPSPSVARARSLTREVKSVRARARREAMKSRAHVDRAHRIIQKATEFLDATKQTSIRDVWIDTDPTGIVIQSSREAVFLTGYSSRFLRGRLLPILFVDDRPRPAEFRLVALGHPIERAGWMRPKERRAIHVAYRIALAPDSTDRSPIFRWTFQRID
jgi:PAS domain-containing protein